MSEAPAGVNKGLVMGLVFVSMAGWMFGADTGTISGLTSMPNYKEHFGEKQLDGSYGFSTTRQGLIVSMVNIGNVIGCLMSSFFTERFGKKKSVIILSCIYLVGVLVQLTANRSWVQMIIARIITGLGIGSLAVVAPSYQSECAPKAVRGIVVSTYQLMCTLGILVGYFVNYGTNTMSSTAAWRIPIGLNLVWGVLLAIGVTFLPESPRQLLRNGNPEEARAVLAKINNCDVNHSVVLNEFDNMEEALSQELAGGPSTWGEIFAPAVRYRTFLGVAVMSLQQLVGANYFFYYGTSIFTGIGMSNVYLAQIILGTVNCVSTFGVFYLLDRFGRRGPLIVGAGWMFLCFLIFASVGSTKLINPDGSINHTAGSLLIAFSCFYIAAFAVTWGPAAYVIVGESYPLRVQAKCAGLATASNFVWNFVISFFTPFIVESIGFKYGYVFAIGCLAAGLTIFFFAKETKGLSIDDINDLYQSDVKPWKSGSWTPPSRGRALNSDNGSGASHNNTYQHPTMASAEAGGKKNAVLAPRMGGFHGDGMDSS